MERDLAGTLSHCFHRIDPFQLPVQRQNKKHRDMRKIAMLGSGFIGRFYADSIQGLRSKDTITSIYSRREESARKFAEDYNVPHWTTTMEEAIHHPEADTVVVSLPNNLHEPAVLEAAAAGKARSEEHTSELQSLM